MGTARLPVCWHFFPNLLQRNIRLVEDVVAYAYLGNIVIEWKNVQQVALVALSLQSRQLANLCLRFIRAKWVIYFFSTIIQYKEPRPISSTDPSIYTIIMRASKKLPILQRYEPQQYARTWDAALYALLAETIVKKYNLVPSARAGIQISASISVWKSSWPSKRPGHHHVDRFIHKL